MGKVKRKKTKIKPISVQEFNEIASDTNIITEENIIIPTSTIGIDKQISNNKLSRSEKDNNWRDNKSKSFGLNQPQEELDWSRGKDMVSSKSIADESTDWRREQTKPISAPIKSISDTVTNWREKATPIKAKKYSPPLFKKDNWRKNNNLFKIKM